MAKLSKVFRLLMPLAGEKKKAFAKVQNILSKEDQREIKSLLKEGSIKIEEEKGDGSTLARYSFPKIICFSADDEPLRKYIEKKNSELKDKAFEKVFAEFSKNATEKIFGLISPNIEGMQHIKQAAALQLFSDKVHILLLGDPGTGKTEILRSASEISPIGSFGLGSGTTGVGLSVTVKGNEVMPGLLPMADKGLCAIDELNLMEERDRASLYNAMEKGFVSYDKGGKHFRFDARIKVIATANPKGDKFSGRNAVILKKQLPFDSALLSRFNLVFLVRKPGKDEFRKIAKSIVAGGKAGSISVADKEFVRAYISSAEKLNPVLNAALEQQVVDFVSGLKDDEDKYLIEITPRLVKGFLSLAKASAKMRHSANVEQQDIDRVKEIVAKSLEY
jgi:replicative DNA helicase Mcm